METTSLKTLATKILTGSPKGNRGETRTKGYGCGACGNKIYQTVQALEVADLPAVSPWTYEHRMVTPWKCEHCGSVYEIIGGSKGLQPII